MVIINTSLFTFSSSSPSFHTRISVKSMVFLFLSRSLITNRSYGRKGIRLGLPSKGRMADHTVDLFKHTNYSSFDFSNSFARLPTCGEAGNPRQYVAHIPEIGSSGVVVCPLHTYSTKKLQGGLSSFQNLGSKPRIYRLKHILVKAEH